MGSVATIVIGVLSAWEWRRGSTWRIGLYRLDGRNMHLRDIVGMRNPVVVPEIPVTGRDLRLTADPHLFQDGGNWYLFFEGLESRGHGEIWVAVSRDLTSWRVLGPVLDIGSHISYPTLTVVEGQPRLVVESSTARSVTYYTSRSFPSGWEFGGELLQGRDFADPTIFWSEGRWWLFTETSGGTHDRLDLYSTARPDWTDWTPHPQNPISTDARWARPAGSVVRDAGGRLIRFGQDCSDSYGGRVAVIEVLRMTPDRYEERFVNWLAYPRAAPSWASLRSHHVSICTHDGQLLAAVDGRGFLKVHEALRYWASRRLARLRREAV